MLSSIRLAGIEFSSVEIWQLNPISHGGGEVKNASPRWAN
jgi:hypothetical protein